jgi:hypothetical protein
MADILVKGTVEPAVVTGRPHIHVPPPAPAEVPDNGVRIHIRMMSKGWENYTGDFGSHNFTNGLSDEPLPQVAVDRVATQLRCIDPETGLQVGPGQRLINNKPIKLTIVAPLVAPTTDQKATDAEAIKQTKKSELEAQPFYSHDQLCGVVDERGIQGLRDIAQVYGVKGRAIPELMASILRAQDVARARRAGSR